MKNIVCIACIICFLAAGGRGEAQYYENYFGTNKVHYTAFNWKILETEHFEIYYYPEMRELAERAAGFAEEQYLENQTRFNHSLVKKVPMIIFSSHLFFEQTNTTPYEIPEGVGGFFEFFKGRVVLPSDGSTTNFKRVIRHELVHVFMDSKVDRILSQHRKLSNLGPPLWFTEGLAEFWSGEPDFQAEMVMRDATINGSVVSLEDMYRVYGTYYMYKLGENFLHFLSDTYGPQTVLLLLENIWKSEEFETVVQKTVGERYPQLSQQWLYWLKKKYFPTLQNNDAPSMVSREMTNEGFSNKPTYFSTDEKEEIYYVANRVGYTNIYKQALNSLNAEVVIKGERSEDFESFHFFRSKIDINKKGELAFVTKSGEKDVLHVYDTYKKEITHRYMYKDLAGLSSPSWSPDGNSIVFSGLSVSGNDDLYILRVAHGDEDGRIEKITNDFYDDRNPAWSPDGNYIVFSSDRTNFGNLGAYNLYLYDIQKRQILCMTTGNYNDDSPAWSPKGDMIAFTSNRVGTPTNIWVMPFRIGDKDFIRESAGMRDTASFARQFSPRQLSYLTSAAFDPVWTKSGDLVYSAFENFSFKLRQFPGAYQKALASVPDDRSKILGLKSPWTTPKVSITQANSRPYRKKYGLDFVQGAFQADPVFGSGGGAQVGVTDMLGDDQYYLTIYNTSRTSSTKQLLTNWNFILTKVDLGNRTNFAYGIYRFKGEFFEIGDQGTIDPVDESRYGGFFQISYPLSKFQRIETSVNVSRFQRASVLASLLPVDGVLVSNFVNYSFDNSLWSLTGPLDGTRTNVTLGYTTDIYHAQQNYYTAILDYRNYSRLTTRSAFAFRSLVEVNDGKNPQNFLLGGSWDLRGYPRWSLPSTRFFVINNELRFPFIDAINLNLPFGGLGFRSIRGALFMDIGSAWGSQTTDTHVILGHQTFDGLIGSVGTGFRLNFLGAIVLRFDFGKMFDARGYRIGKFKLPGNRDRFIATNFDGSNGGRGQGFGGRDDKGNVIEYRRWSRGIFFQFWFGYDF
jgi:Tol biopolymer transport system component